MSAWARWVRLLARREPATSLAVARIVAASTVCASLVGVWTRGVADAAWVDDAHGGMYALHGSWLRFVGGATAANVHALLVIGIGASVLMALGAATRLATALTWLAFRILAPLAPPMSDGSDYLLLNVLFVLMLSGCGRAASIDAWLRRRGGDVPAWPRWLLVVQLVIMYFTTALQKLSSGWIPGGKLDALWYILQQPTWQRFPMGWLWPFYPVTQALTLATWLFELSAPVFAIALWLHATRRRGGLAREVATGLHLRTAYLGFGVCLHLGITAFLDIQQFLGGVLALYACCFSPYEWRAAGGWIARRLGRA